ncbi:MAG: hypothetical protein WA629_09045 [Candidatus Aquilonibacter sp.]
MHESLDRHSAVVIAASRNHLYAIMKNVSAYARSARQLGVVDKAGLGESLARMNEYLRTSDVFDSLKDFQAEALYDASVALSAAYKTAAADSADGAVTKETFGRACESLRKFWVSMGDVPSTP